jgi:hypothetical protein
MNPNVMGPESMMSNQNFQQHFPGGTQVSHQQTLNALLQSGLHSQIFNSNQPQISKGLSA